MGLRQLLMFMGGFLITSAFVFAPLFAANRKRKKKVDEAIGAAQRLRDTAYEVLAHGVVKEESDAFTTFKWELGDPCADSSLKSLKGFVQDLVKEDLVPSCFGSVDAQLVKETLRNTIDRVKKDLRERRYKS